MSYFGATGTHWFGFLVTSPLGFKARVGSALQLYSLFCGGECNVQVVSTLKLNQANPSLLFPVHDILFYSGNNYIEANLIKCGRAMNLG